ncbi:conserved hypothetical protein [Rippkaea orientalis PCC 8801]|uniref:Uncharacterized protein n=1 Tax=Rippkaea orientalis (strain PCC 8801 / RF-1) TaxID=41431 RepID=B7K0Z6_RIPO1|nr:hypothetical protein [Rippkaea orientalis]ACK65137.1 conserved hypothetical protein [Rippkaea orientalis PCC 8801]
MNQDSSTRLDRLEALAENILTGLAQTNLSIDKIREELSETNKALAQTNKALAETNKGLLETRAIANSNAKSIQALSGEWQETRKEWEKDRRGIYQLLGQLTRSMSDFYDVQSDFYYRFDQIDERQVRITEILNRYLPPDNPEN